MFTKEVTTTNKLETEIMFFLFVEHAKSRFRKMYTKKTRKQFLVLLITKRVWRLYIKIRLSVTYVLVITLTSYASSRNALH